MKSTTQPGLLFGVVALFAGLSLYAQSEREGAAPAEAEAVSPPETQSSPLAASQPQPEAPAQAEPVVRLPPVTTTANVDDLPKTREQAYLDSFVHDPAVPYPVAVRFPTMRSVDYGTYYGATLQLEFYVGADGVPTRFRIVQPTLDPRLSHQIIDALKTWRFSPAHEGDIAVPARATIEAHIGPVPAATNRLAATRNRGS
jgi:hypothetical protein